MKLWHYTLIMVLTLTLLIVGCGQSSKDIDLQNYLTQVEPLIEEGSDMAVDLLRLAEDAGPFGLKNADQILATYSERYDDLLSRFEAIECPKDAVNLRKYTIQVISYIKQMVDEMSAYITTRDTNHIDKAESYATAADESILLAMDEWDKLSAMAGEGDGINVGQIFLGLLALGVAVSIALFVLQLTLGVGFGVLGGITVGIGAIVGKIKGGHKRREQEQARWLNYDSVALESHEEEDKQGVWEIYRKEWETADANKKIVLNKRMLRWQELMKNGWTARQAYLRVLEEESNKTH